MSSHIQEIIEEVVSNYVKSYNNQTNLLGVTSVRNIIYILTELEEQFNLQINDSFIQEIKILSVENLIKIIPRYTQLTC